MRDANQQVALSVSRQTLILGATLSLGTSEQVKHSLVQLRITGGDNRAAVIARFTLPAGHGSARCLDHGNEGLNIVGVKCGLDHEVDQTGLQQAVVVTIAAKTRAPR